MHGSSPLPPCTHCTSFPCNDKVCQSARSMEVSCREGAPQLDPQAAPTVYPTHSTLLSRLPGPEEADAHGRGLWPGLAPWQERAGPRDRGRWAGGRAGRRVERASAVAVSAVRCLGCPAACQIVVDCSISQPSLQARPSHPPAPSHKLSALSLPLSTPAGEVQVWNDVIPGDLPGPNADPDVLAGVKPTAAAGASGLEGEADPSALAGERGGRACLVWT